jgi:hypothetical protein
MEMADLESVVPPAGVWGDNNSETSIEVCRHEGNHDRPPEMWTTRDWRNGDRLAGYWSWVEVFYEDATENSILGPHEGGTPEGRYHTLIDESEFTWSGYADTVLLLADFNRMASVVSMKTQYNKGKLEYYLSRGSFAKTGPAFGVLTRVIKLTFHKTLLYGLAQSFFILNFQMMIYNMLRLVRGSADYFSLAMVTFGVSMYLKTCYETFQTVSWINECLQRPANQNGFKDEEKDGYKKQLRQSKLKLEFGLACFFLFGLMLIWKVLQSAACPENTLGGMGLGFAACGPVKECCRTTCLDSHFLNSCGNTADHELYKYMSSNWTCLRPPGSYPLEA